MDFKFVSQGLFSEKQNILQHMHKKEFWILTNKCGNNPKYENEAEAMAIHNSLNHIGQKKPSPILTTGLNQA